MSSTFIKTGEKINQTKAVPRILCIAHSDFDLGAHIMSWIEDQKYMPGITRTAKVLATSKGCPRQIIRYSPRTYAFQCHPEVSFENVQRAISHPYVMALTT